MRRFTNDNGIVRFKANSIVRFLLDEGGLTLNDLAARDFPQADWEDFYQMIGYSLIGYHELSEVSDESCLEATRQAQEQGFDAQGCRDHGCPIHCGVSNDSKEALR